MIRKGRRNSMEKKSNQNLSRRDFLKVAGAGLGSLVSVASAAGQVYASSGEELPLEEHWALLYDATKCSGCRECETACKRYNKLPEEDAGDLSGNTFTLIKLYESEDDSQKSFRKYQCMHCVDPACAVSCPVSALHKIENGPVVYDAYKCIGCRYCMQACAFGIPRYDWSLAYPFIRKCEMCYHREAGPACAEICPKQALIFGKRGDLLEIAKTRIAVNPGKYFEDRVYGEFEGGGTSVLMLSAVPFEAIGLPVLDNKPLPDRTQWALNIVPIIFFGVGGLMSAIYQRTKNDEAKQEGEK
jgi:formate dehydrogenase iron-sulfur subunit